MAANSHSFDHANRSQQVVQDVSQMPLIATSVLPDRYRGLFKFSTFNPMQSACFPTLYHSNSNMAISSPTGSGKTVLFEIAILKALMTDTRDGGYKIIYIAPTKALCHERLRDWSSKFSMLGLKCGTLTGDTAFFEVETVKQSDVIITTPEKWDSITRRWNDYDRLMKIVRLVLVDEVHMLRDDRGATLEVVVSRMKYIAPHARFIALSASIPNASDIADWLGQSSNLDSSGHAYFRHFGDEFRPVKLDIHVLGYNTRAQNTFQLDKVYDTKIIDVLKEYFQQKQVIIFCQTRKMTESSAKIISSHWIQSYWQKSCLYRHESFDDNSLAGLCSVGVAFHHAGLTLNDRLLIEKLFLERRILIICCTSTLSINLPAHLVIIKGTSAWQDNRSRDYNEFEIQQMVGRAGRPQFDSSGVAVIMTTKDRQEKYEQILCGSQQVESCLHLNLVEHMNAEICLRTIKSIADAMLWLRSTYLYVRIKKNPMHYNVRINNTHDIEIYLDKLCTESISKLVDAEMVNRNGNEELGITEFGKCMALFYVHLDAMTNFMQAGAGLSIFDVLLLVSDSTEFKDLRLKQGEKKFYKEVNNATGLRFPLKNEVTSYGDKVNLIIQFTLGKMDVPIFEGSSKHFQQLQADKAIIFLHLPRLLRCMLDIKVAKRDAVSVKSAFELCRSVEAEIWDNSSNVLLQIDGIGSATVRKLVMQNIRTMHDLRTVDVGAFAASAIDSNHAIPRNKLIKFMQEAGRVPQFEIELTKTSEVKQAREHVVRVTFNINVKLVNVKSAWKKFRGKQLTAGVLLSFTDGTFLDYRR
ncbi:P-loop containing nucleoside triphosphate hydrolase protein, partial [Lipomyces japonicus]|uniref:P-loop containing nucleoside triphosphate hydrolase protein n=1 Tax=Lipomyces japonicus TaxID=56871 RepID=UPI0034CD02D4